MIEQIIAERSLPQSIRCDNGPELTSRHFLAWNLEHKINLVHTQSGKPTQNGYVESFNGKLREECLCISWFQNLFEARRIIANWRRDYNERRPHSSLNYLTPAEFAARSSRGKDAASIHLEKRRWRFPLYLRSVGKLTYLRNVRNLGAGHWRFLHWHSHFS